MDPFLGQIQVFGFNFPPRGWALCDGQILPISQNTALFSLLGTVYGGDGRTTFALPDLRGRVPVHPGTGPGLSNVRQGERGGSQTNILNSTQLPAHTHTGVVKVSSANASQNAADANASIATPGQGAGRSFEQTAGFNTATPDVNLNPGSIEVGSTGSNQPINNMQPYLGTYYCIALQGIFPSRN